VGLDGGVAAVEELELSWCGGSRRMTGCCGQGRSEEEEEEEEEIEDVAFGSAAAVGRGRAAVVNSY
jgi:hypothetical protein